MNENVRSTMDFGIDLGTTTSIVAVATKDGTEVFQTDFGTNYVPSVVWIDKKGTIRVGELAKNRLSIDKENVHCEFKTFMGKNTTFNFKDSGKEMKPEELSAEVLKTLRQIVKQRKNEDMNNAVITVPADFRTPQNSATDKAAELAGFKKEHLIQEPVAAAFAYGSQEESDNALWMVYDFGGGTFDAAIGRISDGSLTIIANSGDNNLGGKNIDWDIVNQIFAPHIREEYNVTDFNRQNPKWIKAFAILKTEAERAKMQLSQLDEVDIYSDPLGEDDSGENMNLEYNITREQLAKIMDPYVEASLNKCHEALQTADVKSSDITKMIMVGGQTLSPYLREKVYQDMQITQEYSIDPVTVVARGAATYASTKRVGIVDPPRSDTYQIIQKSEPAGNSLNPNMAGKVKSSDETSFDGFTIEFIEIESQWNSGSIKVTNKGAFRTRVKAEERFNEYQITLKDAQGNILKTTPDKLTYRHMKTETDEQRLTNSIGIGLADNTFDIILEEGTPLPTTSERKIYKTTKEVRKGSDSVINIPLYEGENVRRADRNMHLGSLVVKGEEVDRDLPMGSEVEITMDVNESRLIECKAYIPNLEKSLKAEINVGEGKIDHEKLRKDFEKEKDRFEEILRDGITSGSSKYQEVIDHINKEKLIEQIEDSLYSSDAGEEAIIVCENRLVRLKNLLDQAEEILQWPKTVQEARRELMDARIAISQLCPEKLNQLDIAEKQVEKCIADEEVRMLDHTMGQIFSLKAQCMLNNCDILKNTIIGFRNDFNSGIVCFKDETTALRLIEQGERYVCPQDKHAIQNLINQIFSLKIDCPKPNGDDNDEDEETKSDVNI